MTEQQENEAICEWLGWKRHATYRAPRSAPGFKRIQIWIIEGQTDPIDTPTFLTGNDMQLMFEGFERHDIRWTFDRNATIIGYRFCFDSIERGWIPTLGEKAPDTVRNAVLVYIGAKS